MEHKKVFEEGHTHINNYKLAKHIVDLSVKRKVPDKHKKFIIKSLLRLSNNNTYSNQLKRYL